ncbi:hypothetical protein GUJ93_ZPchr0009g2431 [Zizania palustris]|uniref:Uncharacterized protein n=1 Tax=Zizania palustris TaxID=103762 RepID=A0A8J5R9Z9_ZIZPA|nr:hypothetical protein GUJ93_ZPchr0009g2431 [Zizania palustris]
MDSLRDRRPTEPLSAAACSFRSTVYPMIMIMMTTMHLPSSNLCCLPDHPSFHDPSASKLRSTIWPMSDVEHVKIPLYPPQADCGSEPPVPSRSRLRSPLSTTSVRTSCVRDDGSLPCVCSAATAFWGWRWRSTRESETDDRVAVSRRFRAAPTRPRPEITRAPSLPPPELASSIKRASPSLVAAIPPSPIKSSFLLESNRIGSNRISRARAARPAIVSLMAQRDKKEETTELRAPEITLCANSCGFPGNPATQNLCQNCFLAATASTSSPSPSSLLGLSPALDKPRQAAPPAAEHLASPAVDRPAPGSDRAKAAPKSSSSSSSVNRCSRCRKRVGLTGFRCRCGHLFCGEHRYSDRHGCSYDYKAAARDAIAKNNPVVRAAKIVRF